MAKLRHFGARLGSEAAMGQSRAHSGGLESPPLWRNSEPEVLGPGWANRWPWVDPSGDRDPPLWRNLGILGPDWALGRPWAEPGLIWAGQESPPLWRDLEVLGPGGAEAAMGRSQRGQGSSFVAKLRHFGARQGGGHGPIQGSAGQESPPLWRNLEVLGPGGAVAAMGRSQR